MPPGTPNIHWLMYNSYQIHRYFKTLPLKRRILARFFEKYRITKEEYDKWFLAEGLKSH